ncbi:MarR family winged helix-turn-helix transcriptional regulator [Aquabacterium sp.]|uniref:MarR family winged helix-turn-helix transcriptional regulator n=1 Tax=Aquabacterium sp. TaxID=1872578 RepID=UPI002CB9FCCD|nr:MarR family transcriptional regulator [Aquabacterium sp.]HSW08661.1 MarR family transcriptional regulator [Aquabacterium sp.]
MKPSVKPATFYRPDALHSEDSIGLLTKRAMQSITLMVDRRLAPHDLTHAQWVPLFKLARGECTTMASLAREVSLDPGSMTRALDRLEAKGLLRRVRSKEDRRVIDLELTEEGLEVSKLVPDVLAEVYNAHLAGFSRAEWTTLIDLLQRLVANGDALRETKEAE